jgi:hypothetical protein
MSMNKIKHTRITTERKNMRIVTAQAEITMKVCNCARIPKEMNNMPCVLPTIFFQILINKTSQITGNTVIIG